MANVFGLTGNPALVHEKIKPGIYRKLLPYVRCFRVKLGLLIIASAADAAITVAIPLMLRYIINDGILRHEVRALVVISVTAAALAMLDAVLVMFEGWVASQISMGMTRDMRVKIFDHVQRQPIAFFTRTQTGALVSRLSTDIYAGQQVVSTILSTALSSLFILCFVLAALFLLSWTVTVAALVLIPFFIIPTRILGRRLQGLTRESMQGYAAMAATLNERFNVAGALLAKLYGRPGDETDSFAEKVDQVRESGIKMGVLGRSMLAILSLITLLVTILAYGLGGVLTIDGTIQIGTVVALVALLNRVYTPVSQLSNLQVNVMTALVSFDRIFEILELEPLVTDRVDAIALPAGADRTTVPGIEFDHVSFRYPTPAEVSLGSLETIAFKSERSTESPDVLHDVSFFAAPGQLTALVGPSGAGKTTISHLASRMYDPSLGHVRVGNADVRDVTAESLHAAVGVVLQDAHLFHDTIRANLAYANPGAAEAELIDACRSAQIWELISSLPDGLDTVVGDRGYRLSGGEKQRLSLARLVLKAPSVVILDEATAHLDSESEAAIQRALQIILANRTSLVIAHRLSTIRNADQILVMNAGRIVERGTHEELLAAGGHYESLCRAQFFGQEAVV
jgi:ATP-binding cassette subfamily B protein